MTDLQTFRLPASVERTDADLALAGRMVRAWQADGIFQIATDPAQNR